MHLSAQIMFLSLITATKACESIKVLQICCSNVVLIMQIIATSTTVKLSNSCYHSLLLQILDNLERDVVLSILGKLPGEKVGSQWMNISSCFV